MKAVHVANTNDIRIYYLVESDDKSTGVLVKRGQAPVFINFFSYVSKKPNIKKIMDSEFHEFLWTGNKGSMRPRWEHMFIDRVAGSNSLLEGVNIITKFKTDNDESERRKKMEAKANHAIEYKSLVSSGLNEKAFANRIGRTAGRVASGSVRGFRRGVRFDPNAVDADMDGFVQEGTQFARPAVPKVRTDLRSEGMRSLQHPDDRFLPLKPKKPATSSRVENITPQEAKKLQRQYKKDLKRYNELMDALNSIVRGGDDAEYIIEQYDSLENQLRELIGGREIKTVDDVREIAAQLHTGFGPNRIQTLKEIRKNDNGATLDLSQNSDAALAAAITDPEEFTPIFDRAEGSYWDLLDPTRNKGDLGHFEKATAIGVLQSLMNTDYSDYDLQITTGEMRPEGFAFMDLNEGLDFDYEELAGEALKSLNDWLLSRGERPYTKHASNVENWQHAYKHLVAASGGQGPKATSQEFTDKMTSLSKELTTKIYDDLGDVGFTKNTKASKTRFVVVLDSNRRSTDYSKVRHNNVKRPDGQPTLAQDKDTNEIFEVKLANYFAEMTQPSAQTNAALSILIHADTLPLKERKEMWAKAAAILRSTLAAHEMGHTNHFDAEIRWANETGEGAFKRVIDNIKERLFNRLSTDKDSIKLVGDLVRDERDFNTPGAFSLAAGIFGPNVDVVIDRNTRQLSHTLPMHDMSLTALIKLAKRDGRSTNDIVKWLSQPILDSNGNSFAANEELANYFEQLAPHAQKLWGIDLSIKTGEDFTLGHVLYGMNPIAVKKGTDGSRGWDRAAALPDYGSSKDKTGRFGNFEQGVHWLNRRKHAAKPDPTIKNSPEVFGEIVDVRKTETPAIKKGTDKWAQAMADSHAGIMRDDVFEYEPGSHPGALPKLDENNDPVIKMIKSEPAISILKYPDHPEHPNLSSVRAGQVESHRPRLDFLRQFGLPPLDTKKLGSQQGQGIEPNLDIPKDLAPALGGSTRISSIDFDTDLKTDHIPPGAFAPLLDAHVAADVVLEKRRTELKKQLETNGKTMDLEETLKGLTSITFDNPDDHDQKIGIFGSDLKYSDLHGISDAEQKELLEQTVDDLLQKLMAPLTNGLLDPVEDLGAAGLFMPDNTPQKAVRLTEDQKRLTLTGLIMTAASWDSFSETTVSTLEKIADGLGGPAHPIRHYGSARTEINTSMLLDVIHQGRGEAVAELVASMTRGIDIPVWDDDGKRRDLTHTELNSLKQLWYWLKSDKNPGNKPKIRSNGVTYDA